MSSVEKVSNCLVDRKEEVITTPLLEKKSSTKDVDKGTDEFTYVKKAVFVILSMGLDNF